MKFVIISPRQDSGGAIVLHSLCRNLIDLGHDAKVLYCYGNDYKNQISYAGLLKVYSLFVRKDTIKYCLYTLTNNKLFTKTYFKDYFYEPIRDCKRKWLPCVSKDTILIYPDIVYGNPFNANRIVRWFLFHNRFLDCAKAYGCNDLFFCYREIFNDYSLNPECRTLFLQNFDFNLYKRTNYGPRKGTCYLVRKGDTRKDLPKRFDGPVIDSWSEEEKVKAFNEYAYCFFYDTQTFYTVIASVCGCIPVVVLEPGKSKEDYLGKGEHPSGVAYGYSEEEINYAVETREALINYLYTFDNINKKNVVDFLEICKKYFNI